MSTDISRSIYRPSVDRYVDWYIGWVSVDISADTSVECRLICRPMYRSRGAQNTHDPNILRWNPVGELGWHSGESAHLPGRSLSFDSPVALFFTSKSNLLLFGWIVSTAGKFTHDIKGPSSILDRSRCYRLRPLRPQLNQTNHHVGYIFSGSQLRVFLQAFWCSSLHKN